MKRENAIRLVSTKNLSREEWLAVRGQGIGSSDAACAVGISPYKSPLELWLEKTERQAAPDLASNDAVFWGTTLEHIIANVYAHRTGTKVRRLNAVLQHPEHPFMLANLDRVVQHPTDGSGISGSQNRWREFCQILGRRRTGSLPVPGAAPAGRNRQALV